jgi:carbamoyl-phosphate synthase large subunit
VPRWNFDKFEGSDRTLGVQMKSVGEAMGIGRSFQEALQKACQSLEINATGWGPTARRLPPWPCCWKASPNPVGTASSTCTTPSRPASPSRRSRTSRKIDIWFLRQIEDMILTENEVEKYTLETIPREPALRGQTTRLRRPPGGASCEMPGDEVYKPAATRSASNAVYKLVDTCAGEFPAKTPYYYSTFEEENESVRSERKKIVVLGSGPNRIGQGIEFDYCCVHGVLAAKELGYETIMINCNPETVSTDFDIADKLYFEPVFWEHIYEIILLEQPRASSCSSAGRPR